MKKFRINSKIPFFASVTFLCALFALFVGYGAYVSSYPATASSWATLSSSEWNKMVSALQTLDTNLSAFSISGGKVGIGIAASNSTLELKSLSWDRLDPILTLRTSLNPLGRIVFYEYLSGGDTNPVVREGDSAIIFSNDNTSTTYANGLVIWWWSDKWWLKIMENGNVGIGVATPTERLDVAGIVKSSGWFSYPDGITQTKAFQWIMTVRTNVQSPTLGTSSSVTYTASCLAGEIATWGGCQDSGYKDFYYWAPTSTSYTCGWYNTSWYTRTYTNATVYVNCLK